MEGTLCLFPEIFQNSVEPCFFNERDIRFQRFLLAYSFPLEYILPISPFDYYLVEIHVNTVYCTSHINTDVDRVGLSC